MVHKIKSCESEPECGAAISSPGILTAFFRIGDQKEKKKKTLPSPTLSFHLTLTYNLL